MLRVNTMYNITGVSGFSYRRGVSFSMAYDGSRMVRDQKRI